MIFRYIPTIPAWSDDDVITCWENTTLFITSSYQYIILAFVLNKGYPHRKPFYKNSKNILFKIINNFSIITYVFLYFQVSFTIVTMALTLFTLILQLNTFSTFTNIFDMVNLSTSHNEKEQRIFLISLLAFPILHFYLAANIEVII